MSKVKLYIAATLDGFIAREDGSLDWLDALPNPNKTDYGYEAFFATIDTVIMGKSTYEEILGFGVEWPYAGCKTYILTSDDTYKPQTAHTEIFDQVTETYVKKIKAESSKNIWIVGGGKTMVTFLNSGLVDEMILFLVPTIIGKGIRLFPDHPKETLFKLVKTEAFETGVVSLTYTKT